MNKTKVVYNACYGGFGLSRKAAERLAQLGVTEMDEEIKSRDSSKLICLGECFSLPNEIERHDPRLVQVIEEFGDEASGAFVKLQIETIKGNKYIIDEYDGHESVTTPSDIKWIIVK
jgi:hypothetical protein